MKGKTVVIRTLDSGADKLTSADTTISANPALGLRAIRLCLSEPQLFNIQLRAILRASKFGKIKILIPMLSSLSELRQTKLLIERAKKSLDNQKILYNNNINNNNINYALLIDPINIPTLNTDGFTNSVIELNYPTTIIKDSDSDIIGNINNRFITTLPTIP